MDLHWDGRKIWIVEGRINPWRSPTLIAPYYRWRALCDSVMSGGVGVTQPVRRNTHDSGSMWVVCNYYVPRMSLPKADAFRWLGRTPRKSGWMIFVPTLSQTRAIHELASRIPYKACWPSSVSHEGTCSC